MEIFDRQKNKIKILDSAMEIKIRKRFPNEVEMELMLPISYMINNKIDCLTIDAKDIDINKLDGESSSTLISRCSFANFKLQEINFLYDVIVNNAKDSFIKKMDLLIIKYSAHIDRILRY